MKLQFWWSIHLCHKVPSQGAPPHHSYQYRAINHGPQQKATSSNTLSTPTRCTILLRSNHLPLNHRPQPSLLNLAKAELEEHTTTYGYGIFITRTSAEALEFPLHHFFMSQELCASLSISLMIETDCTGQEQTAILLKAFALPGQRKFTRQQYGNLITHYAVECERQLWDRIQVTEILLKEVLALSPTLLHWCRSHAEAYSRVDSQ